MPSTDRNRLIEAAAVALYDSALGLQPWSTALAAVAGATGGEATGLFPYSSDSDPRIPIAHTLDTAFAGEYLTHQRHVDPWLLAHQGKPPILGASLSEDILSDHELVRTPFYNEFGRRAGIRRLLSIIVPVRSATSQPLTLLSIMRGHTTDYYGEAELNAARSLAPHIEAALNLHVPLRGRSIETATALFDNDGDAFALVGRFGFLLHANSAFLNLARSSPNIAIAANHLSFHGSARALNDICQKILHADAGAAEPPRFFEINPAAQTVEKRFLMIAELPAKVARALNLAPRLVILKLSAMPTKRDHACNAAAEAFGLSAAETRILHGVVAGQSVEEIAARAGTAPGTVRIQLKAIYAKSGIHRQSELVARVLTDFDPALRIGL